MTLWLVTKFGVYDHGVCYVAESEAGALAFCREFAPDRDGHHDWRIDEVQTGQTMNHSSTPWGSGKDAVTSRDDLPIRAARVEYRDEWQTL